MPLPFYPFYWGDYSSKTFDLTRSQHGAYFLFLRHYYTTGLPILHEQRYSIARALDEQSMADADLVLKMFWVRGDEGWINERAVEIKGEADAAHERRVNAGSQGGKAPRKKAALPKQPGSNAPAMPEQPSSNQNQNHIEVSKDTSPSGEGGFQIPALFVMPDGTMLSFDMLFERFWALYPAIRDKGHKGEAKIEFKNQLQKGHTHETIGRGIAKFRQYCDRTGEKQPDFKRWLKAAGWERDYIIPATDVRQSASSGLAAAVDQALRDTTRRSDGNEFSLEDLGILPAPGKV